MLDQSYADGAAFFPLDDSVNNRVFYQRLEKKRRYLQVFQHVFRKIIGYAQPVTEACPFKLDIAVNDPHFFGKRNKFRGIV